MRRELIAGIGNRDRLFLVTKVTAADGNSGTGRAMLEEAIEIPGGADT
ncbi:MAG: hypothetical protein AB7P94_17970 [Steroidobacteraceae bacterium]